MAEFPYQHTTKVHNVATTEIRGNDSTIFYEDIVVESPAPWKHHLHGRSSTRRRLPANV